MNKIILTNKEGATEEIELAEEAIEIKIEATGLNVEVKLPRLTSIGYEHGKVHSQVIMNERISQHDTPDVSLTVGEVDSEGFKWRADAMLYITDNGRIIAKNQTLGYASNEKPIATRPWKRSW